MVSVLRLEIDCILTHIIQYPSEICIYIYVLFYILYSIVYYIVQYCTDCITTNLNQANELWTPLRLWRTCHAPALTSLPCTFVGSATLARFFHGIENPQNSQLCIHSFHQWDWLGVLDQKSQHVLCQSWHEPYGPLQAVWDQIAFWVWVLDTCQELHHRSGHQHLIVASFKRGILVRDKWIFIEWWQSWQQL